jgi:hypothetical protein
MWPAMQSVFAHQHAFAKWQAAFGHLNRGITMYLRSAALAELQTANNALSKRILRISGNFLSS